MYFQKLEDDTKHIKPNGTAPSHGATYTKVSLDGKEHIEQSDVVLHNGQNGVILENKAKEYKARDVLYEPGNDHWSPLHVLFFLSKWAMSV